jgi:hypothetical protein
VARRVLPSLDEAIAPELHADAPLEFAGASDRAKADVERLFHRIELELNRAG